MKIARKLLVVYFDHNYTVKKLAKHGNLIYHSKKLKYAYIYINAKDIKIAMNNINNIKGVTKVEESLTDMNDFSFTL